MPDRRAFERGGALVMPRAQKQGLTQTHGVFQHNHRFGALRVAR